MRFLFVGCGEVGLGHEAVARGVGGDVHGVLAREACLAVARRAHVGQAVAQALQADERQRVGAHPLAHLVVGHVRGDQLVARVGVDAVEARPHDLGADDAHVHLGGAGVAQHLDELLRRVAAHDGVVDDHQALAADNGRQRVELQADAQLSHGLRGLDERAAHVAVLHDAVGVRDAAFEGEAHRRRDAAVGHAEHQVGVGRRLAGQDAAHVATRLVDRLAVHDGVGAGEVHVLENAAGTLARLDALLGGDTLLAKTHDLAGLDVAHVFGAHDVQAAGFAGNHPAATLGQLADAQRADAVGVAERIQRVGAGQHHGVGALHILHGVADALAQVVRLLRDAADGLGGHLGVGARAQLDALVDQAGAQAVGVHQGAIMRQGDEDLVDSRDMRLRGLP